MTSSVQTNGNQNFTTSFCSLFSCCHQSTAKDANEEFEALHVTQTYTPSEPPVPTPPSPIEGNKRIPRPKQQPPSAKASHRSTDVTPDFNQVSDIEKAPEELYNKMLTRAPRSAKDLITEKYIQTQINPVDRYSQQELELIKTLHGETFTIINTDYNTQLPYTEPIIKLPEFDEGQPISKFMFLFPVTKEACEGFIKKLQKKYTDEQGNTNKEEFSEDLNLLLNLVQRCNIASCGGGCSNDFIIGRDEKKKE
jgi:hypothetical protein